MQRSNRSAVPSSIEIKETLARIEVILGLADGLIGLPQLSNSAFLSDIRIIAPSDPFKEALILSRGLYDCNSCYGMYDNVYVHVITDIRTNPLGCEG